MSDIRDILSGVISDRESLFADGVINVRTGRAFFAEIEPVSDMEINAALGRDARESVTFHVRDRIAAAEIGLNDKIVALGQMFKVLRRSDNPVSVQVDFGAMKVTNKDA